MSRTYRVHLPLSALALAILTSCGGSDPDTANKGKAATSQPPQAVGSEEAQTLFNSLCFTCHGKTGKGDGPGAATLEPKPRSFTDAAWQDSVDDTHIGKVIVYGGSAVQKSAMMPANPQLKSKPEVVKALVKIVRGFRGK